MLVVIDKLVRWVGKGGRENGKKTDSHKGFQDDGVDLWNSRALALE
jgi:hypothetical protein